MKMARASEKDLEAANAVARAIEELEKGYMPSSDDDESIEFFDLDNHEQCRRALSAILDAAAQGSMFRVTFGMLVVCDPRNKVLDPDADTLELHPEHAANALDAARYRFIRDQFSPATVMLHGVDTGLAGTSLDEEIDDAMQRTGDAP